MVQVDPINIPTDIIDSILAWWAMMGQRFFFFLPVGYQRQQQSGKFIFGILLRWAKVDHFDGVTRTCAYVSQCLHSKSRGQFAPGQCKLMCESTASVLYPHSKSKQTFGMNESSRNVSLILCWFPYRLSVQKQYRCCLPVNCHNRHSMGIMAIENNRHNCHALQIRNIHSRGGNHIWIIFGSSLDFMFNIVPVSEYFRVSTKERRSGFVHALMVSAS